MRSLADLILGVFYFDFYRESNKQSIAANILHHFCILKTSCESVYRCTESGMALRRTDASEQHRGAERGLVCRPLSFGQA